MAEKQKCMEGWAGVCFQTTQRRCGAALNDGPQLWSCALERGYALATRNERHFKKIPGLQVPLDLTVFPYPVDAGRERAIECGSLNPEPM